MFSFPLSRYTLFGLFTLLCILWILSQRGEYLSTWDAPPMFRDMPAGRFDERLHPTVHNLRDPKKIQLHWTVGQVIRSQDGVEKSVYTVNGLFPGPTIEARPGDQILLTVYNELKESTAIHFHGIRHLGSNAMDGTPGVTQCAIQPGRSFLYNFTIATNQTGTYWWHSHSSVQRADGLFGAFIIHEPLNERKGIGHTTEELRIRSDEALSERLLLVGDWYHKRGSDMLAWYRTRTHFGFEPTPDAALFNGVNTVNCSRVTRHVKCDESNGTHPSIFLDTNVKTRLRLVNTGNLADLEISLGSHTLIVVEADGSNIKPFPTNSVTLSPGQRYSVILIPHDGEKPKEGDTFWLKLRMSPECFNMYNPALDMEQNIRVHYGNYARNLKPETLPVKAYRENPELQSFDPFAIKSLHTIPMPPVDEQIMMYVNSMKLDELGGIPYGYVNQTRWAPLAKEPLILKDTEKSLKDGWGDHQLVVTTDRKDVKVIELIINNLDEGPHPFHLHGHQFYPLLSYKSSVGLGMYNFTAGHVVSSEAPVARDTFTIPRRGHLVIRFVADAPGMWLFHCHVLVHLSTGMAMTFNIRPDMVPEYERENARNSCILSA